MVESCYKRLLLAESRPSWVDRELVAEPFS